MATEIRLPRAAAPTVFMVGSSGDVAVIDTVAVERAVTGSRGTARLTADEARYAASVLFAADVAPSRVAVMVGVAPMMLRSWFPVATNASEPVCGTRRGYQAHRRRKETACGRCITANALADQHYKLTGSSIGAPSVPEVAA
ncbi:hypothetical protein [Streptomyces sp. NPDC055607]